MLAPCLPPHLFCADAEPPGCRILRSCTLSAGCPRAGTCLPQACLHQAVAESETPARSSALHSCCARHQGQWMKCNSDRLITLINAS